MPEAGSFANRVALAVSGYATFATPWHAPFLAFWPPARPWHHTYPATAKFAESYLQVAK